MQWTLGVAAVLALAACAYAEPFVMNGTTYQVQDVAGSGSNEAVLELDFGSNAAPIPFLFGYQWDGTATPTGRDMLTALQANNAGLTFSETYYADYDEHLLNTLNYQTYQPPNAYPNDFWLSFSSADGQTWAQTDLGYDQTPLTNGSFFGWALQTDDPNEFVLTPPYSPPSHFPAAISAAAPEPATLGVMAIGLAAMMKRRRR